MFSTTLTPDGQFPAVFPDDPIPPIAELGTLPTQFKAIEVYLAIPDRVREIDRDYCRSYVCDLFMGRKGATR